jgi:hypothetical protein
MKKLVFSLVGIAIAIVVMVNVNLNSQNDDLSEISLKNVEALGLGEDDGAVDCCPDQYDTCVVGTTKVPDYDECD